MSTSPEPLSYNTLPPSATISVADDGETITLTAAAQQDAGPDIRRRAARSSAWAGGIYSAGILMLLGGLTSGLISANWNTLPWWTGPLAGVFALALFAMIWQVAYRKKLDAIQAPLRQSTIIAIRSQRLVIETAGPLGNESHDFTRMQIKDVKLLLDMHDEGPDTESLTDWIAIFTQDGEMIHLLPARGRDELKWVARLIRKTMGIEPVDAI